MNNVHLQREQFGAQLRELRHQADMSLRDVEAITGTTYSMIATIERGEKAVGSDVAGKFADAFNLRGEQRDQFLMAAAATRKRDKLVGYSRCLAPEILNYVAKALQGCGFVLEQIDTCQLRKSAVNNGKDHSQDELVLGFKDGKQVVCGLVVAAGT